MGRNAQSNEVRRSRRGAGAQQFAREKAGSDRKVGPGGPDARPHGVDKGAKGGGRGGGVPPDEQPEHP
jgi:hypothetical protein